MSCGGPVYLLAPGDLDRRDRSGLGLLAATCLPVVVAITTIGVDQKIIGGDVAESLVCAAMVSVLVLPLLAGRVRRRGGGPGPVMSGSAEESESW